MSDDRKSEREPRPRRKSRLRENVESIGTAVILFLVVRAFVVQAFRIPSESMEDTLLKGDFLFVNKMLYGAKVPMTNARLPGFRDVKRGDVVVFKNPVDRRTDFIKRCVAVEGDTVRVWNNVLYINGDPQEETYTVFKKHPDQRAIFWPRRAPWEQQANPGAEYYVVPEDHFFAMGDNRNNSSDSRFFRLKGASQAAVPNDLLVGKAIFIYASLDFDDFMLPRFGRMFRAVK